MLKYTVLILLLMLMSPLSTHAAKCPDRIVSLTLASDEILIDSVEEKSRIAALTYLSNDENISNVAGRTGSIPKIHANIEQVLSIHPDLVILASYTNQDFIKQLENTDIRTLFLEEFGSIKSIKENIKKIGNAVCEKENAGKLISEMDVKLAQSSRKIPEDKPRPTVLYYSASGNTAGKGSTVNEVIEKAGGINMAAQAGIEQYGKISLEYIIKSDPDIILLSTYNPSDPDFVKDFISGSLLKNTSAVRNNRVNVIPAKHLISASHYVANSVVDVVKIFQDEYWKNAAE